MITSLILKKIEILSLNFLLQNYKMPLQSIAFQSKSNLLIAFDWQV